MMLTGEYLTHFDKRGGATPSISTLFQFLEFLDRENHFISVTTVTTVHKMQTTFPAIVQQSIGAGYVLVVKNCLDFDFCKPDLEGVDAHVEWFHNFWWVDNDETHTKLIAFYDTKEEALRAGEDYALTKLGYLYNWAVYGSDRMLVDGKY